MKAEVLDRINVENNPVNFIDPLGLSGIIPKDTVERDLLSSLLRGDIKSAQALAQTAGLNLAYYSRQLTAAINNLINKYPLNTGNCDKLANNVYNYFSKLKANPKLLQITDQAFAKRFFTDEGILFAKFGWHQAVQVGNRIYDAITGPKGMTVANYLTKLRSYNIYPKVEVLK